MHMQTHFCCANQYEANSFFLQHPELTPLWWDRDRVSDFVLPYECPGTPCQKHHATSCEIWTSRNSHTASNPVRNGQSQHAHEKVPQERAKSVNIACLGHTKQRSCNGIFGHVYVFKEKCISFFIFVYVKNFLLFFTVPLCNGYSKPARFKETCNTWHDYCTTENIS